MIETIHLQLLLATFAGWAGRNKTAITAYLVEENRVLKEQLAARWTYPGKRVGHPGVMKKIRRLIVQMAEENPNWGYARIQGHLKRLNHRVARGTVADVLRRSRMVFAAEDKSESGWSRAGISLPVTFEIYGDGRVW